MRTPICVYCIFVANCHIKTALYGATAVINNTAWREKYFHNTDIISQQLECFELLISTKTVKEVWVLSAVCYMCSLRQSVTGIASDLQHFV
jgi:hypothetical protein